MPYCTRNGVRSYYEVSGEGYPFVFMHANPFDRRMFLYQAAHFSTYFKVINIDLRAYGYSDKPATPITMTDLCEDVVAVCRQEGATGSDFRRRQRRWRDGFTVGTRLSRDFQSARSRRL